MWGKCANVNCTSLASTSGQAQTVYIPGVGLRVPFSSGSTAPVSGGDWLSRHASAVSATKFAIDSSAWIHASNGQGPRARLSSDPNKLTDDDDDDDERRESQGGRGILGPSRIEEGKRVED